MEIIDTMTCYLVRIFIILNLLDSYNNPLIIGEDSTNFNIEESYINASCLDGGPLERDKGMFIATQGPLKKTIRKFWKLVIQKGVSLIIMLCREQEDLRVS
jgi:protein tyrosine phosphatase